MVQRERVAQIGMKEGEVGGGPGTFKVVNVVVSSCIDTVLPINKTAGVILWLFELRGEDQIWCIVT